MSAAFWQLRSAAQIVFAGEHISELKRVANSRYLPTSIKMKNDATAGLFAKSLRALDGKPTVYVCQNFVCQLPTTEPSELEQLLG
jgi:hypothetical protein